MTASMEELCRQAELRVGTTLNDKYRLEKLIGIGGMASVYEGVHRNGNRVAIKIVHIHLSADREIRSRFLQEGYAANNADHPGVVRALDDDVTDDGAVFLVMELLYGSPLEDDTAMPIKRAMRIGFQLLDVLAATHEKGIVHRDLKPQNLFLTEDNQLKVLDFGLARIEAAAPAHATQSGQVFGTPAYMPPEQALGRVDEVDKQSDIWAAGATLFTLMSGEFVHEANTSAECLIYSATRPCRSLAVAAPHVPAPIVAVIDKAVAFAKSDRYPDARTMQADLESAFVEAFREPIGITRQMFGRRGSLPEIASALPPVSTTVNKTHDQPTLVRRPSPKLAKAWIWLVAALFTGGVIGLVAALMDPELAPEPERTAASGIVESSIDEDAEADPVRPEPTTTVVTPSSAQATSQATLDAPDLSAAPESSAAVPPAVPRAVPASAGLHPKADKTPKPKPPGSASTSHWDHQ